MQMPKLDMFGSKQRDQYLVIENPDGDTEGSEIACCRSNEG